MNSQSPDEDFRIPLLLLQAIMEKVTNEYVKRGLDIVELDEYHLYHAVAADEMFDMTTIPTELVTGDLGEDWNELKKLILQEGGIPSSLDMERLGRVLIAISEAILE